MPEALGHYEASLKISPETAWVHLALALQLSSIAGREGDAAFHAREALRIRPDFAEAYNCLGIIDAQAGRLDSAREDWERALQLKPGNRTAIDNLRRLDRLTRGQNAPR